MAIKIFVLFWNIPNAAPVFVMLVINKNLGIMVKGKKVSGFMLTIYFVTWSAASITAALNIKTEFNNLFEKILSVILYCP
jgi:hypothetical protein